MGTASDSIEGWSQCGWGKAFNRRLVKPVDSHKPWMLSANEGPPRSSSVCRCGYRSEVGLGRVK